MFLYSHIPAHLAHKGFGLGLRPAHYSYILKNLPDVDWFEIISENFIETQGKPKENLALIKEQYPIVMHGVSLSIGSTDAINTDYLQKLKNLIGWVKPLWVSDHLCWTGVNQYSTHDLLPMPYTDESLRHVIKRIHYVQDYLQQPIALENPSTYLEFNDSRISEAQFMAHIAQETGCYLLLDVNNVYVTCYNHRLSAKQYIDALPLAQVIQIHLAGHQNKGTHIIDTHDAPVCDSVWQIYQYVVRKAQRVPNTMIEWDDALPDFATLYAEIDKAKTAAAAAHCALPFDTPHDAAMVQRPHNPMPLIRTQYTMQQAILSAQTEDADMWIVPKPCFTPQQQLNVYNNAYQYRLFEVVSNDYPVLHYYLGHKRFEHMLYAFIAEHPSTHFNIAHYAWALPDFMQKYMPDNIFGHQLAQLETMLAQLIDSPSSECLTPAHIQHLNVDDLMAMPLPLRRACQLCAFAHNVNDYYQTVIEDSSPAKIIAGDTFLALFRHKSTVWRLPLSHNEYRLLCDLHAGHTVGQTLSRYSDIALEHLTVYFARWMEFGLLAYGECNAA